MADQSFDYVIVGAGSAGCAVAGRLSEDPGTSVLLIEAGGRDRSLNIAIPAAFPKQFKTKLDWDYSTGPEPHLDGRELYVPRGKSLGGSSSMNAMMYVRGRPLDFEGWAGEGADGWGWDDVLPVYKRMENDELRGATDVHGAGGPVNVAQQVAPRPLSSRFVDAAQKAGIPFNEDINSPEQDGVGWTSVTQKNGRRWSAADAYLKPAMKRPNLTVVTGGQVQGVVIEGGRATGVRWRDGRGREQTATAGREVVLSAGAIGSPQILMLSGVGPAGHLSELGIDLVADLPVGENLQDHPYFMQIYDCLVNEDLADAEKPKHLLEWALRRTGPLTTPVAEAMAFVRSRPGLPAADLQLLFGPVYYHDHGFDKREGANSFSLAATLISPKSRGRLRLRSSDPSAKPDLVGNHLGEPEDMAAMVHGFKRLREIARSQPLETVKGDEIVPGDAVQSDADIEGFLRRETELLYHPVGTCRMGSESDDGSVVDPRLRVRGIDGLRVADASVMPVITGGNTNAPTIMIGEKAADLIRAV